MFNNKPLLYETLECFLQSSSLKCYFSHQVTKELFLLLICRYFSKRNCEQLEIKLPGTFFNSIESNILRDRSKFNLKTSKVLLKEIDRYNLASSSRSEYTIF